MKAYIISIVVTAIICATACSLFDEKRATGKLIRLLSGILMVATVISPLKNISFKHLSGYFNDLSTEANLAVNLGIESSQESAAKIIKEKSEAYILDKAKTMGLDVAVEVELDDNNSVPCGITILGKIAPYDKIVLADYIEQSLGIPGEKQKWK